MLISSANASVPMRELMARFSGVRLATPEDAQPLARFINETAMSTDQLRIGFTRGDDYFSLLKLQAEKYAALICEEQGQIVGVGALTVRSCSVRGQKTPLGYFQDLRVSPSASHRTRQNFYQCFSEFVRICPQLPDFDECSLFVTAILDGNIAAKAALSRQSFPLEYSRITHYTAHMWPKPPLLGQLIRKPKDACIPLSEQVRTFYARELGRYAYDLSLSDLDRLADHCTPVTLEENGEIIGACLLVQSTHERQLRAEHTKLKLTLSSPGTFITALRTAKSLSSERTPEVKKRLLSLALRRSLRQPGLFTGYLESENDPLQKNLIQGIFNVRTRGSLYRVFHPEHTALPHFAKGFLRPSHVPCFDWIFS